MSPANQAQIQPLQRRLRTLGTASIDTVLESLLFSRRSRISVPIQRCSRASRQLENRGQLTNRKEVNIRSCVHCYKAEQPPIVRSRESLPFVRLSLNRFFPFSGGVGASGDQTHLAVNTSIRSGVQALRAINFKRSHSWTGGVNVTALHW